MKRLLALFGFTLIFGAAITGFRAESTAAQSVRDIAFVVYTPDGRPLELHFAVQAEDDAAAFEAARAATETLLPGALAESEGTVRAAYAAWPWLWPLEMLPVPVAYNPAGAPVGLAEDAVRNGVLGWNGIAESSFWTQYTGTTSATPDLHLGLLDGQNTIGWLDLECPVGCVLGVTMKFGDTFEVDIILNSNPAANLGDGRDGTADLETVVLHEVGHLAGLDHSCQPQGAGCTPEEEQSVMFPRYKGVHRGLALDDIAGLAALYPALDAVLEPAPDTPAVEYQLDLRSGWNLVVLPPGRIDPTMANLECVDSVFSFEGGAWRAWIRGNSPALHTLTAADGERAYWLHSLTTCGRSFVVPAAH